MTDCWSCLSNRTLRNGLAIELSRHKLTNWLYIEVELAAKTNSGQRRRSFPAYSYLTGHYSTSYRYCFDLSSEAPRNLAEPLVTSWCSCFRAPRLPIHRESNARRRLHRLHLEGKMDISFVKYKIWNNNDFRVTTKIEREMSEKNRLQKHRGIIKQKQEDQGTRGQIFTRLISKQTWTTERKESRERDESGRERLRAIAQARYKLHLNRSRGTHGIRNLNGCRAKERQKKTRRHRVEHADEEETWKADSKMQSETASGWNGAPDMRYIHFSTATKAGS